jgi:hypothetical protein
LVRNLGKNRIIWLVTVSLSLIAALSGVFRPGLYSKVISGDIMPGVFGQDLMTIAASLAILFLLIRIKEQDSTKHILILGIIGYLFYAYGIYVIERVYTVLYFVYLAIFGLSFWSLVYGAASIRQDIRQEASLSRLMRNLSAGFSLLVALIFDALWISALLPLLQAGEKIEFLYSVYILDLCFIMPAFILTAILVIKGKGLGLLLLPVMFVLGFTLIFSLVVAEAVKPFYYLAIDAGALGSSLALSLAFLALTVFYLRSLKINGEKSDGKTGKGFSAS